jgi:cytochrome c oxidase assembly protein subunit 11
MNSEQSPELRKKNRRLLLFVMIPIALVMLGFTFAQVPMFRLFCEKIGFGISPNSDIEEGEGGREVKVLFTGVTAGSLPVYFKAKKSILTARIGKRFENEYHFVNMSDDTVYFRPVHSILPEDAAKKFTMTKCFCFDDQTMLPHEEKDFTVICALSKDLKDDVEQVTLNYTLFEKNPEDMEKARKIPNVAESATKAPG